MRTASLVFIVLLIGFPGFSQTPIQAPPFTSVPPVEDVNLYASFFEYQQDQIAAMNAAIGADPAKTTQLNGQMAATLGITPAELPIVIANLQQVTQNYSKLAADTQAGNLARPQGAAAPTPAQLASAFQFLRVRLTTGTFVALFQQLSPSSWKALHSYIIGTYKTSIYQH